MRMWGMTLTKLHGLSFVIRNLQLHAPLLSIIWNFWKPPMPVYQNFIIHSSKISGKRKNVASSLTTAATVLHLRNGKDVPCFYRVIETQVEVWENKKCCANTSRRRVFSQLFRVLPNFHERFYNSIETRRTCFLFLLETTATRKRKTACLLWSSICNFSLLAPSIRQQLVFPSSYRNTIFNQINARIFLGLFSKMADSIRVAQPISLQHLH